MESAKERLTSISNQLTRPSSAAGLALLETKPDDVVITLAKRTALTRARKGGFKDTPIDGLILPLLRHIKETSGIDPSLVEEVVVGNVLHSNPVFVARAAVLAVYPSTTATSTVSRWCSSGLLAVQTLANQIRAGNVNIGIAIGAESMSLDTTGGQTVPTISEIADLPAVRDHYQPMGWTSENVASDFNISRRSQDEYAAASFEKAEKSQTAGWSVDEILPVTVRVKNPKTGEDSAVVIDRDDGVRPGTTAERLSQLKAAFPQWSPSTTTGGNASQITDGAAALLLMRRSIAEKLGQPILAKFAMSTVVGLEPRIMGIGPVYAIPKLLGKVGLTLDEVDVVEINEAFASMSVYCKDKLGLGHDKMNPRGGAIAIGHPLGCTGARQIVTAISELKRTGKRIAITSMCVGSGQGMASVIVSECS